MLQELPVLDLHHKIADGKRQVDEIRQQFDGLASHLVRAVDSRQPFGTRAQAEHFQNQLICQKEVADQLVHDLKQARKGPEKDLAEAWGALQDRVQTFTQLYIALKRDLDHFTQTLG